MKGIHFNLAVPPRSIAAYATDDFEHFESEDKSKPKEDASRADQNGTASDVVSFPLPPPPPPPISKDNYLQYKGDDEQVEVDGQEEDLVEKWISSSPMCFLIALAKLPAPADLSVPPSAGLL
ncbi:hypothetical protein AKJ16_DCAP18459 [Drosera capensis]